MYIHEITDVSIKDYDPNLEVASVQFYIKDLRRGFIANFRLKEKHWEYIAIQPLALSGERLINQFGDPPEIVEYINSVSELIIKQIWNKFPEIKKNLGNLSNDFMYIHYEF
ncbi:hypothetical protein [Ammoniphilus sp. CFH 90114]|uniref:hypothetical protein n=1 Tax=Ammoniphilus sp. CFH 90114 TaxID=2493665 RepID=UPI00100E4796|nr:hypothetical protein [Ammoniphilus sp. CFH 90114]RXT14864.1 hypothetical protein EIZ39_01235 [Ammoniphilus sp. CFH 90114]